MLGWLIYSAADAKKNKHYIEFYLEEGNKRNIQIHLILLEELKLGIKDNRWFITVRNQVVTYPDFVVCRTIYPLLSKQMEALGMPVFNNSFVAEICNNKARTYQYVASLNIPMIDTEFCTFSQLEEKILSIAEPTVLKAVAGHGGSQVFLLNPEQSTDIEGEKKHIITNMKGSDVVLQPLTGTRHQDLRVYVIGKQIIACVLRTAKEGFKSNFSLGGEVESYNLSQEERKLVEKIIDLFDFGMVGIDFIIGDQGELIFNEIEDVVGARMLYQCTDINLVGLYLDFIMTRIKDNKG